MVETCHNHRILVVDDTVAIHEDFRKILCRTDQDGDSLASLEEAVFNDSPERDAPDKLEFEISSAYQGEEGARMVGQAAAEGIPFAMAFVDMRMPPGCDGLETIGRMWEVDPHIEIAICTAYSDYTWLEIIARLSKRDQLLILKKPFDPAEASQIAASLTTKWFLARQVRAQVNRLETQVAERTADLEESVEANQQLASAYEEISRENRRLLDWVGEPIISVDRQGTVHFANQAAARLLGFDVSDLLGRKCHDLMHHTTAEGTDYPWEHCPINHALRNGTSVQIGDELFWRKDGTSVCVDLICCVAPDLTSDITGAVISFREVAEKKLEDGRK